MSYNVILRVRVYEAVTKDNDLTKLKWAILVKPIFLPVPPIQGMFIELGGRIEWAFGVQNIVWDDKKRELVCEVSYPSSLYDTASFLELAVLDGWIIRDSTFIKMR